jgi:hypothetical protein
MEMSGAVSRIQSESPGVTDGRHRSFQSIQDRLFWIIYLLALVVSVSIWFSTIRAPLWLDETISFWQINAGFSQILSRQGGLSFPAYSYILWLATVVLGKSEIALRIPSILAMLGAVYLLYRAARELFDRESAIIVAIVFCLHPIVMFASIDVRPYAFGALAINAAIYALVRLRHNDSSWWAVLFGFSAACIVYFHFLFVVVLLPLAIGFFAVKAGDRKTVWRQGSIAIAAFTLAFLPVIPGLQYMFRTSGIHVFSEAPSLRTLILTLAPQPLTLVVGIVTVLAIAAMWRPGMQQPVESWRTVLCVSLALVPLLILFAVSVGTSIHIFVDRYRLAAIPGIALCWGLVASKIDSRALRLLSCVAIVVTSISQYVVSPSFGHHRYTWKYALEFAEKNASPDDAPVLMCSDLPEADYIVMPISSVKDNPYFSPLAYYKLSVPVVPLPRALNDEAKRVTSQFLEEATQRQERFLAIAFEPSYDILDWIADRAAPTHNVRILGVFDRVKVLEFTPRAQAAFTH